MTIFEAKNIFSITNLSISAEYLNKIKKKLMLQWHPDIAVNKGVSEQEATIKTQNILLAFKILSENLDFSENVSSNFDEIDKSFINRITMKSSNVKWIDYIKDLEILVVKFKTSSGYYLYYDVPLNVYLKFINTDSPGKFVHQYLYGYKYESLNAYAEWLNIYKKLSDITDK